MFKELFENDLLNVVLKDKDLKLLVKTYEKYGDDIDISKGVFSGNKKGVTVTIKGEERSNIEVTFIPFMVDGNVHIDVTIFENSEEIAHEEFENMGFAVDFVHSTFNS